MPLLKYVSHSGEINEVEVASGTSIMQGAVNNMIDGIIAECGGSCSCATCHCYIDDAWIDKIPGPSGMEKDMLECVREPKENSRLSCQVTVTEEMEGLTIHLPESQY